MITAIGSLLKFGRIDAMTEPELLPCPHTKLEYLKDPIEPGWYCCLCGNYWEPPGLGASAPGLDREKFDDAQTLAAYWLMADSENRRKMWESDIKKICEALLTFSAPAASRGADKWEKLKEWEIGRAS